MGAWIETQMFTNRDIVSMSLPSWERGLKLANNDFEEAKRNVAPLVGAWIETHLIKI